MKIFETPEALAVAFARDVAGRLRVEIAATGRAGLAVSGGTTPVRFFQALSREVLDWARVVVTLVDERCVSEDSPRSNTASVKAHLLQNEAAKARFVPTGDETALTVAVLGMGLDGHTASLFPGGDHLAEALDPAGRAVVLPMTAPNAGEPRVTLTLPVLLVALHIEGLAKRQVLEHAQQPGPVAEMPVRAVLARNPEIYWSP